jgi:hypothetical protein
VNGSNVAAAAAGPWAAAQAVVVPPGTRSVAPVYFTRRRAGASKVTLSVPGSAPVTFSVTVTPARAAKVRISRRGTVRVRVGRSIRLRATARDRFGNVVTTRPGWSLSPRLARFTRSGASVRITAIRPGRAVLTARVGKAVHRVRILVKP